MDRQNRSWRDLSREDHAQYALLIAVLVFLAAITAAFITSGGLPEVSSADRRQSAR